MKHAVITNSNGDIVGTIGYESFSDAKKIFISAVESFSGKTVKNEIRYAENQNIYVAFFEDEEEDEYFCTPTTIRYIK